VIDIGVTKLVIIGGIALVVIGPEKLPGLAKTVGTLLGRARRYVADVKDEVNRSMELDELKKMKDTVESAARDMGNAARDVENTIQTSASDFEKSWAESTEAASSTPYVGINSAVPQYQHPKKKWRIKRGTTPNWYKARTGLRIHVLSGAARVARFRPTRLS
jgi:sec-independent protein translocase protein TatB